MTISKLILTGPLCALVGLAACTDMPMASDTPGPVATIAPAAPAAPVEAVEPNSGISTASLVAIASVDTKLVIFYVADLIDPAQKAAAPARLCASRGQQLGSVEDSPLAHPDQMPGVMQLIVQCT